MSDTPLYDRLTATHEGMSAWQQERSIFETTELICEIMEREGVSRSELADRLGKSRGYVTKLLDGGANMTLRTISDVFTCLGYAFHPRAARLGNPHVEETSWEPVSIAWCADDGWKPPKVVAGRSLQIFSPAAASA